MASQQLSNYLRTYRKRSALSQAEVAFLLGQKSGAKVCRYERFKREPGLQTALAYVAIFQKPVSDLFPGLYQEIARNVRARAAKLAAQLNKNKSSKPALLKRQILAAIVGLASNVEK
jgi:transcriptional regulator with XRE-family HTH domain